MWKSAPLSAIIHWHLPNYINPHRRGPELWIFSSIFLAAATVCVGVRLWTRLFVRRWFGPDDYLVVLGYISSIVVTVLVGIAFENYGWDRHVWDLHPSQYSPSAKYLYFSRIAWGVAATTTRASVLCLYYRLIISAQAPRSFLWINHAMFAATIFTFFYYLFWGIFVCTPISAYWSYPVRPEDHCLNDGASLEAMATINTIQEFLTATMPVLAVFILRVRKEQRWAVLSVLSLGYSVVIAGICRIVYIHKVVNSYDPTWWAAPHWICSEVENYLALVCACAPPLRPVLGRLIKRARGLPSASRRMSARQRSWFGALTSGSSKNSTGASKSSGDINSASDWLTAMSRTIDLEGIAVDSYGYRVHISGPSKAERRRIAREQLVTNLGHHGLVGHVPPVSEKSILETKASIGTKTEFTVEARRELAQASAAPWGLDPSRDVNGIPHPIEQKDFHDSQSASLGLNNGPGRVGAGDNLHQLTSSGSSGYEDDSDDSIYALPIMSTSAMQEPERPSSSHLAERLRSRWSTE